MPTMSQTPLPSPNRAIKTPPIMFLTGVFVFFGLFLTITHIRAETLFTDDFEDYNTGQLNAQQGWSGSLYHYIITGADVIEGIKSVQADLTNGQEFIIEKTAPLVVPTGIISLQLKVSNINYNEDYLWLTQSGTARIGMVIIDGADIHLYNGVLNEIAGSVVANETFWISWEWKSSDWTQRVRFNDSSWSAWFPFENNYEPDILRIDAYSPGGSHTFWWDDIKETPDFTIPCSSILNSFDCAVAGCVWHFWPFPGLIPETTFCSDIPTGDCDSGLFDCPNCLTQETCEGQTCYWYQGRCSFTGGAVCGADLLTQFCENEIDCTNAGGFWYTDFCWFEEQPDTLLNWSEYYDENGDYATPTAWISGMATSTTGFFGNIGGFLSTFSKNFNLTDAYNKGSDFGSAIPLARSYLGILDEFSGNLPFGDFFIFILIFTLAVGTFRIVRNLVQVLKFW